MHHDFYAYGEILWDCLPSGRHAGGAPFNVAAHLAQLGARSHLISAIGQDALGEEILQLAQDKGVDTRFVTRSRSGLETGTVQVAVDTNGNATYEIVQPVAWDEISVTDEATEGVSGARSLIFGSLACRSGYNREQLGRLLELKGPVKFFDVNLRPPFVDLALVTDLAKRADVLKLNDDEAGRLASWLRTGKATPNLPTDMRSLATTCSVIAERTNTTRVCITRGAQGAVMWDDDKLVCAPAPEVEVQDTVGAGDAFTAGLMIGLTQGDPTEKVLENACRLGAYVASQRGAIPLLPPEMIQRFNAA